MTESDDWSFRDGKQLHPPDSNISLALVAAELHWVVTPTALAAVVLPGWQWSRALQEIAGTASR